MRLGGALEAAGIRVERAQDHLPVGLLLLVERPKGGDGIAQGATGSAGRRRAATAATASQSLIRRLIQNA